MSCAVAETTGRAGLVMFENICFDKLFFYKAICPCSCVKMAAYVRVKNIIIVFSCAEANRYNGFCQDVFFGRAMCEGVERGGACRARVLV